MGQRSSGCTHAVFLIFLIASATLVYGIYDRPYIGSPKAPTNLLTPSPGQEEFTTRRHLSKEIPVEHLPKAPLSEYRLPTALRPVHYTVSLLPFIGGNFSIMGHVDIEIEVIEPASNITLNKYAIKTFDESIVVQRAPGGQTIDVVSTTFDAIHELFVIELAEELRQGQNYMVSMDFESFLDNNYYGFYRGSYVDVDGSTVYFALTQFEALGARRAFPCFDQPELKATFDITLGREDTMTALANTPILSTTPIGGMPGWSWDTYETTVVMPTYLLAFVVSDFATDSTTTSTGKPFGVWSRPEKIGTAQYALEKGPGVLEFFEGYMQLAYPLPKMDMVSTLDFGGAMENWGLILFSESTMLFDPAVDSLSDQQYVLRVIAHELAHQWFGNIVTMGWWDHIWLNEGFASYMEYIGADAVEPTWNIIDTLLTYDQHYVFERDSLASYSHPIINRAETPEEIDYMFDSITYSKGACLNRMQKNFLTEASFVNGLISYLATYQYSNAFQDYLFEQLTNSAHADGTLPNDMTVKQVMDTWTLQAGYPIVTVNRSADGTSATVSQKRFWTDNLETDELWWVPITYTTQDSPNFDNTVPSVWMSDTEITVSNLPISSQWVIFNIQETGYYRVNYDDNNWNLIFEQLATNPDAIHPLNRAQINDDYLDISRAGLLSYSNALRMLTYLRKERAFVPWASALNNLDYLDSMLLRTSGREAFKNYMLDLLVPLYNSLGFHARDELSPQDQLLHMLAVAWACDMGHRDCIKNSLKLYRKWMRSPKNNRIIHPNIRKTVYCTAIAEGGRAEWNFAWSQYQKVKAESEKKRLLDAMGCSRDTGILNSYLQRAFTKNNGIKKSDAVRVFTAVAKNAVGRDVAWAYLRENAGYVQEYSKALGRMTKIVAETFNTEEEKTQLEELQTNFTDEIKTSIIIEAVSTTNRNIFWMSRNYNVIVRWLNQHGY